MRAIAQAILEVLDSRGRAALATVVRTSGSTPQKPGARLLLRHDQTCVGTVGGGAIELAVIDAMRETLRSGAPRSIVHDLGYDLGMCCGGRMEVFVEVIEAPPRLFIFGAGHIAKPTAVLARSVGFEVTVVDDRDELNSEGRFPDCQRALYEPPAFLRATSLGENDAALIATHDHALDEKSLDLLVQQRPMYIGLVASQRKAIRLLERVTARRGTIPLDRIYAPVGLDVGAETPEEIALAIVAELVALRHERPAAHARIADHARFAERLQRAPTTAGQR